MLQLSKVGRSSYCANDLGPVMVSHTTSMAGIWWKKQFLNQSLELEELELAVHPNLYQNKPIVLLLNRYEQRKAYTAIYKCSITQLPHFVLNNIITTGLLGKFYTCSTTSSFYKSPEALQLC